MQSTNKVVLKGHEARLKVKAGIDKACDAVRPTLGAVGMTALIEYPGLDPIECDDGVTILKNIQLKDRYENMGVQMLRKAALRTSSEGGDGTATTTVLTQALIQEAFKEIADDSSKIREVRERLEYGLARTLDSLKTMKRDVGEEDIERIATIASLDPDVAKVIADIIKEVGVNGVVTVEKSAKLGLYSEVVKGARFEKGLISPFFVNDPANMRTVLNNPHIVLVDRRISTNEQIMSLLESMGAGSDVLFICDTMESVALATLTQNAVNKTINAAAVMNPYSASRAREFLFDIAALTGATVISEERGMRLDTSTKEVCGRAEKVIVTRDTTTIVGGVPAPSLGDRVDGIKAEIEGTTSEYERGMLEDRLAQLTGGVGVIRVGAYTDTEFNAKKYKFENAINATQAALQEGILPGGGVALLAASAEVQEPIFKVALSAPFKQMARNAGIHPDVAMNNLMPRSVHDGYDFKEKKIVEMFTSGIIDPYKVTRLALESAVAITRAAIGMETAIVLEEEADGKKTRE